MLEVINPYSLMVFYVATIVKIYDNRYFKVEVNNDSDVEKRTTFVATKESPYLFNAGLKNILFYSSLYVLCIYSVII